MVPTPHVEEPQFCRGWGWYPRCIVEVEDVVDGALVINAGKSLGIELVLGPVPELGQIAGSGVDLTESGMVPHMSPRDLELGRDSRGTKKDTVARAL